MIDILIGIGILIVVESALIFATAACMKNDGDVFEMLLILSCVAALAVGILLLLAVVSLGISFIANSLPEFAEVLKS